MANKVITDYTAAVSIDASNDYFLLEQSSTYKKINRSIMLGISGSPVGTSDSQSLSNKTLGNTNTITVKDSLLTLQNASDTTKQANFSLAGITTGNTRTITLPDADATLATLAGSETFTNKTLTSPTISGGTIDNSTITVDSISGHTVSTTVTVGGVQMANGVVNTANAVDATSIAAGGVQPQALTSGTGTSWAWQTWTPTWTNLSVGNGTVTYARYIQTGKTVFFKIKLVLGGTSSVTGTIGMSTPVNFASNYTNSDDSVTASGVIRDSSTGDIYAPWVSWGTASRMDVYFVNANSNRQTTGAAAPMAWATGDVLMIIGMYEGA